jgi:hypothetical protein
VQFATGKRRRWRGRAFLLLGKVAVVFDRGASGLREAKEKQRTKRARSGKEFT